MSRNLLSQTLQLHKHFDCFHQLGMYTRNDGNKKNAVINLIIDLIIFKIRY